MMVYYLMTNIAFVGSASSLYDLLCLDTPSWRSETDRCSSSSMFRLDVLISCLKQFALAYQPFSLSLTHVVVVCAIIKVYQIVNADW
jgi:hypothetical protein